MRQRKKMVNQAWVGKPFTHWIVLTGILQEIPIFKGKNHGFL
jgi:hypothetical protein